jgi:PEP-CTERM motif
MSRYVRHAVLSAVAALALAVPAQAATINYTSTFDPSDVLFDVSGGSCTGTNYEDLTPDTVSGFIGGKCDSLSYGHTLVGYSLPPDTLISADLYLYFRDDSDPSNPNSSGNPESVHIELDSCIFTPCLGDVALNNASQTTVHYGVFWEVLLDGSLAVNLSVGTQGIGQNDFFFRRSELNAVWEDPDIELIPEPASLLLFGGGFALIAGRLRRARNRA